MLNQAWAEEVPGSSYIKNLGLESTTPPSSTYAHCVQNNHKQGSEFGVVEDAFFQDSKHLKIPMVSLATDLPFLWFGKKRSILILHGSTI